MTRSPWAELGIAPTADETAIRRAYASKLKTFDPDAEPDRFIALREALATARALARQRAECEVDVPEEALALADAADERPVPEAHADPVAQDEKPGWLTDIEAIQAAIWSERSREDIFPEVQDRITRLLADRQMDVIEHASRVEAWVANIIVQGVPRTNALLAPAINHFGWAEIGRNYSCPPIIRQVLDRYADCAFADSLAEQPGPAGFAYKLLGQPTGRRKTGYDAAVVEGFLRGLRAKHPTAIHNLDPATVAEWDAFIARRQDRFAARAGRWWDERLRPIRKAWAWMQATRRRAFLARILIPFLPALVLWPFDSQAAEGIGALACLFAGPFLLIFVIAESVKGLKQLFR